MQSDGEGLCLLRIAFRLPSVWLVEPSYLYNEHMLSLEKYIDLTSLIQIMTETPIVGCPDFSQLIGFIRTARQLWECREI